MRVKVNGVWLYFDVEGAGIVPDGPALRERPTLILLHGGPGVDHSVFKPDWGQLSDCAQIIYLDHRGNGRSDDGDPADWNLAQWGDDVRGFCDALDIHKPIICGVSFGGFVAQSYATRHPGHAAGLILVSTAARFDFPTMFDAFDRLGGPAARTAAEAYWLRPTPESRTHYGEVCVPLYQQCTIDPDWLARIDLKDDVAMRFVGPDQEMGQMDFRNDLANLTMPILILSGRDDPITPPEFSREIYNCAPTGLRQVIEYDDCGHGVTADRPEQAFATIREFIINC
ncbi:MAG: alpha/beta fold hydrolase [Pikeienuella sp.]